MISIIICSRKKTIDPALAENISSTIGAPYEIIWIDNADKKFSLFSAYNYAASKSKFDILCFMHDDIIYHSNDWGNIVNKELANGQIGIVGIAGAVYKTKSPSPWWISDYYYPNDYIRLNILQRRGPEKKLVKEIFNPAQESKAEVVVLDGVWFCCKRKFWAETLFDNSRFSHFHYYDLDFSLSAISKGYKNFVLYDVLIEHTSAGSLDQNWVEAAKIFADKWEKHLPVNIAPVKNNVRKKLEFEALKNYLLLLSANNYGSFRFRFSYWLKTLGLISFRMEHLRLLKSIAIHR
jgi:hypothetical protein